MRTLLNCIVVGALLGMASPRTGSGAVTIHAVDAPIRTVGRPSGRIWNLWSNGRVGGHLRIAGPGVHRVTVRAYGSPAAGGWPKMGLLVDGQTVQTVDVDRAEPADYAFDVNLSTGIHEIAAAFLNDARAGGEDRNLYLDRITVAPPAGAADPAPVEKSELAPEYAAREEKTLRFAEREIEKNRKSDAVVRVVDAAGRPVVGATVGVEQTGHDFLFGCNIYRFDRFRKPADNEAYKRRFEDLFNYATTGFYWRWYEHQRGKPEYDYTDKVVAWCGERGIEVKGHPLLWGTEAGEPPWAHGQPSPDIQRQRVVDILRRYRGKIDFWEVVNEPSHCRGVGIDQPYRWAREADPAAYTIVNDYFVMADGCPGFFALLEESIAKGVPFDGIGIQAHEPRTERFPLDRVWKILDQYAALGKELHITEFTPASSGQPITGSHTEGVWDEAAQADYAEKFYRVCFAHPSMRAITWWDLSDNGSWLEGGGMLRADMTPKPVYDALKRLIHQEWTTRVAGKTDAAGRFAWRGFRGPYRVAVTASGGEVWSTLRVEKNGKNEVSVAVP